MLLKERESGCEEILILDILEISKDFASTAFCYIPTRFNIAVHLTAKIGLNPDLKSIAVLVNFRTCIVNSGFHEFDRTKFHFAPKKRKRKKERALTMAWCEVTTQVRMDIGCDLTSMRRPGPQSGALVSLTVTFNFRLLIHIVQTVGLVVSSRHIEDKP